MWTLYQILMILLMVTSMWLLEFTSQDRTVQLTTGEWTTVIPSFGTFFIVALIVTFIYFIFLFEAKKDKSLLNNPIWSRMPKINVIIGVLSVIVFILGGTIGLS